MSDYNHKYDRRRSNGPESVAHYDQLKAHAVDAVRQAPMFVVGYTTNHAEGGPMDFNVTLLIGAMKQGREYCHLALTGLRDALTKEIDRIETERWDADAADAG